MILISISSVTFVWMETFLSVHRKKHTCLNLLELLEYEENMKILMMGIL